MVAVAGQQHLTSRKRLRLLSPHHALLLQVLKQRDQTRQRGHPPLTTSSANSQELLGHLRRELTDVTTLAGQPVVELTHQHQVMLHPRRCMTHPQQLTAEPVRERNQRSRTAHP